MKFANKKFSRAWDALIIRYPIFQILETNSILFYLIAASLLLLVFYSVLWAFGVPQTISNKEPLSGVPDNLFSTIIEVSVITLLVLALMLSKIFLGSEGVRIQTKRYRAIRDELIFPLNIEEKNLRILFDSHNHYKLPEFIESFWRWSRVNRDEYFLVEAGSLDIAKLAIKSVKFSGNGREATIQLGQTSFFDIFFTHYCPDLAVSKVQHSEGQEDKSMRWLLSGALSRHYLENIAAIKNGDRTELITPEYIPNPMGMSGIVVIEADGEKYVVLRQRNADDAAARGAVEWSFAGLFESTDWLHRKDVGYRDLVHKELDDELLQYSGTLKGLTFSLDAIGLVINELYLYQPELFSLCKYECTALQLASIRSEFANKKGLKIWLSRVNDLEAEFADPEKCKNLCSPGLGLLKKHLGMELNDNYLEA